MTNQKEALYYGKLDNDRVKCRLCPHGCNIAKDNIGICRVRKNIDGRLYTLNYGKITSYGYDPIEKKPLYHFYPGSKIFSIGSFGCNLKCSFCQNWQIAHQIPPAIEVKSSDIAVLGGKNNSIGIAYTYNEPSIWYEFVLDAAIRVKEVGLKNVLVTNGYIEDEPLEKLLQYIDAMNIDIKALNNSYYSNICGGKLNPVLQTVKLANKSVLVEITTLIVQDENDDLYELERLFEWIANVNDNIPLHLTRYYPAYKMENPPTRVETLYKANEIAKKYLKYVYIGNVINIDRNTYCPECGSIIVKRDTDIRVVGLKDNECPTCGYKINIIT